MANSNLPYSQTSQNYIQDNSALNTNRTRVFNKPSNGYWTSMNVNTVVSNAVVNPSYDDLTNVKGVDTNTDTNLVSCVAPASVVLAESGDYNTLVYNAKTFYDSSNSGNFSNAKSYFGREMARSLGAGINISTFESSVPYSLNAQVNDMYEVYDKGGWIGQLNGCPAFSSAGFSNPTGNGVPTLKIYYNFQDPRCWRYPFDGSSTNILDLSGNSFNAGIQGSTVTSNSVYSNLSSLSMYHYGWDLSQDVGQGANYAEISSDIATGTDDTLIIFYGGQRTANTSGTAERYVWDARPGGGKYLTTNKSNVGWSWNNVLNGGSTSTTDDMHFVTCLADPTQSELKIHASYALVANGIFFSQQGSTTTFQTGFNILGEGLILGTNGNNLGASKFPGPFQTFGAVSIPQAAWEADLTATNREKLIKILHYHHKYMNTVYY